MSKPTVSAASTASGSVNAAPAVRLPPLHFGCETPGRPIVVSLLTDAETGKRVSRELSDAEAAAQLAALSHCLALRLDRRGAAAAAPLRR